MHGAFPSGWVRWRQFNAFAKAFANAPFARLYALRAVGRMNSGESRG